MSLESFFVVAQRSPRRSRLQAQSTQCQRACTRISRQQRHYSSGLRKAQSEVQLDTASCCCERAAGSRQRAAASAESLRRNQPLFLHPLITPSRKVSHHRQQLRPNSPASARHLKPRVTNFGQFRRSLDLATSQSPLQRLTLNLHSPPYHSTSFDFTHSHT